MSKMKKLTALLTAFLCLNGSIFAIPANAADNKAPFSFSTDTFVYTENDEGFFLESIFEDVDFMIVGYAQHNYYVNTVNETRGIGYLSVELVEEETGKSNLKVGDLLSVNVDYGMTDGGFRLIPFYYLDDDDGASEITYLGNGVDVLGKEFEDVIRRQMVIGETKIENSQVFGIKLNWGDVNIDDEITIVDCLSLNRNLLLGEPMCDYAKAASDINGNGAPDSDDVLSILKECIEVTENFE